MNPALSVTFPVLVPLVGGVLLLLGKRSSSLQRSGLVTVSVANLAVAFWLFLTARSKGEPFEVSFGGWEAPLGIAFYIDLLAAIMVLVTAIVGLCGSLYACGEIGRRLWERGYAFFFLLLITGINGAFLTSDLFNLFVWFEVMLMAAFAMMALGRLPHTIEGTTKYVVLNMMASFFFLSGLGIIYGKAGNLNLNVIAEGLAQADDPLILTSSVALILAFGIKAGVFPLYFWLPASYPNTGFTTAAVFGGLLTKVGVYAFFRVFGGAFGFLSEVTAELFLIVGVATMVMGVLGAASQMHTRRILSFHIISQIGYLILCLGLFTTGAFAAAVFYTVHHIIVKTNLFLIAGLIARTGRTEQLVRLGGLFRERPFLAILFAIPALSLGGIPPFSGFWAKLLVIREAFASDAFIAAGAALVVGLLTLFSMVKIWSEAFWKDSPRESSICGFPSFQYLPVALLALVTLLLGFFLDPAMEVSRQAAEQLWNQNPAHSNP